MTMFSESNREHLLDLLTARLEHERTSGHLEQLVISKLRELGPPYLQVAHTLECHGDYGREHEQWLEEQIHALGGEVHEASEMSQLESRMSRGLVDIVEHDGDPVHLLDALFAFARAGAAGWELLAALADETTDREARAELDRRLHEAHEHAEYLRGVIAEATRRELGIPAP